MHWELWDTGSGNLIESFSSEEDGLMGIRELLAINEPSFIDDLALGAVWDECESAANPLPPTLEGEALVARLRAPADGAVHPEAAPPADGSPLLQTPDQIGVWASILGYHVDRMDDPNAVFNLAVREPEGLAVHVAQMRGREDLILIAGSVAFDDANSARLQRLAPDRRAAFLWELRLELLKMGVQFYGIELPIHRVGISAPIYEDGLTRDAFVERLFRVKRALLFILWAYERTMESQSLDASAQPVEAPPSLSGSSLSAGAWRSLSIQDVPIGRN